MTRLQRVNEVEMMHAGTWGASTGVHTFTRDDFRSAVAALDCPAVRRPAIVIGHTDGRFTPRGDGEPGIGYVDNLHTAEEDHSLVGDLAGMPPWLTVDVLASAWPDRSIEGEYEHVCQLGHTHPFVMTAVALLGYEHPAIGTLESIQDVAALYAGPDDLEERSTDVPKGPITVSLSTRVAASASIEDIRRAFYDTPGRSWSEWIEEIQVDPALQAIVHDDETGDRYRVPVTVDPDSDGVGAVTFGDPIKIVIRYEDAASSAETVTASAGRRSSVTFPTREASMSTGANKNEGVTPVTSISEALAALLGDDASPEERSKLDKLATLLDADETAEVDETAETPADVVEVPAEEVGVPETVTVDKAQWNEMLAVAASYRKEQAAARDAESARMVDDAVKCGKIKRAQREVYLSMVQADPEKGRALLDKLEPSSAFPVSELGHSVELSADAVEDPTADPRFKAWKVQ